MQQQNYNNNNNGNRSFKIITVIALCVAVLCLSVAYATLSQKLTINGTATVEQATWDIKFENAQTSTKGNAEVTGFTLGEDTTKIEGFEVKLKQPGDTATLTVDAKNAGSIDAVLLGVNGTTNDISGKLVCEPEEETGQTICGQTGKNDGAVTYQVKYADIDITEQGFSTVGLQDTQKKLAATGTKKIEITVKYDASKITNENLPTQEVTITLPTISFDYGQDDSVE